MKAIPHNTLFLVHFAFVLAFPLFARAWKGDVTITTPNTQMIFHADEGGDLRFDYYGPRACTAQELREGGSTFDYSALPAFGTVDMVQLPALQIQHADGDLNLDLRVTSYDVRRAHKAEIHVFTMQDKLQPVTVRLYYKTYKEVDIIETWTEIENGEKKVITLKRFDSGHLVLRQGDVWLTHLHGDWAAEAEPTIERITSGVKVIRNTDGARNAHLDAPEVMLSLDGQPQENCGRVIGAALCWSGNYELRVNTQLKKEHHFYAGIDPQSSEYVLEPKEVFITPHLALCYSTEGMGGVSRTFHRWARTCGMLHRGMKTGDILLNSWEGLYFDINEERMVQMMDDIAKFGGELFVMDDGWFGNKYPRNNDSSSLGDWVVDKNKLPGGIKALTDAARDRGIKFGIWIEPEAVNTKTELFEKHPEWALQTKNRELKLGRGGTQLVLDMTNPQVQDFAFGIVDDLLTQYPEIAYIKWDANASIQNFGSSYLPQHKQQNLYIDYHLGLIKVLQRIRAKYPDVVIQDCASGGGRANYGLLPYFDEFWVSDNTDALQRVFIQWGTSMFFPANAMACHINHCPYWNTGGRVIPIKFRCDVAMSGRLGIELQPKDMTDEEREQCTRCFEDYKLLRPIVQTGDLYRLISPYDGGGVAALMYTLSPFPLGRCREGGKAALFIYKVKNYYNQLLPRLRLAGLNPEANYTLTEKNVQIGKDPCTLSGKSFNGRFLMEVGIEVPLWEDYASRVFELTAISSQQFQSRDQLLQRLVDLQKRGIMFGHQDDPFYGITWQWEQGRSDILESCGDYPAVMGFDLGGIEVGDEKNLDSVPFTLMRDELLAQVKRGGIAAISWHPRNPVTGGNAWDVSDSTVVRSILPGGTQHATFLGWMKRVSVFLQSLKDERGNPVPFIFRPWHENNGSWFWWGQRLCSDREYHALWCMLQDHLLSDGLTNILWSYSPNVMGFDEAAFLRRYPGDNRVDIIGLDAYQQPNGEADFIRQTNADLDVLCGYAAKTNKLVALTECGYQNIPDPTWWTRILLPILQQHPLSYLLVWRNGNPTHYFAPAPHTKDVLDFGKMVKDKKVLMLKDLQK